MRVKRKLLTAVLGVGAIIFAQQPLSAHATTYTYDLEGTIKAPIFWEKHNKWYETGDFLSIDVTAGDLSLTFDSDTGITKITGTTRGCVVNCNNPIDGTKTHRGAYIGSGDFSWDLTFKNPINKLTNDDGTEFGYGMQQVGGITLLNAPNGVPAFTPITAKNDKTFAFRVFPNADGTLSSEGWLVVMGGVVGGFSRLKTGRKQSNRK